MRQPSESWIKIICTLGPSSFNPTVLTQMQELGVSLFRLNMSHTSMEALKRLIPEIQRSTSVPLCIDTEGAQIRTGEIIGGAAEFFKSSTVTLLRSQKDGTSKAITLTPPEIFDHLAPGTLLKLDFNGALLLVLDCNGESASARVLTGGIVGTNKGVATDQTIPMPFLSKKDRLAIEIGLANSIANFALSFASDGESVSNFRDLVGSESTVISKVESRSAVEHIDGIMEGSDIILIDRGDLSRDFTMEYLPFLQQQIVLKAHQKPLPVYVATNLLDSMMSSNHPSRSEISDIAATLRNGANGLVLAAETAIGQNPVRCVQMVRRLIDHFVSETWVGPGQNEHWQGTGRLFGDSTISPIVGHTSAPASRAEPIPADDYPVLNVGPEIILDAEQIALGVYSPLQGFMGRKDIDRVLADYKLEEGSTWTLPIVLPTFSKELPYSIGDEIALECNCCNNRTALIKINDVYQFDAEQLSRKWFGTSSLKHPGVSWLFNSGDCFIGGSVTLLKRHPSAGIEYSLTPSQVRAVFTHNGWDKIVGFHTRNTPHRAHEFLLTASLERAGADGLLVHPAIGQKKSGDFNQGAIIAGYEALVSSNFMKGQTLLSGFSGNSRYAGPREAIFTAMCRKNFGCTHFVVGRDHTGVGNFYSAHQSQNLFDQLEGVGIEPLFFDEIVFDPTENRYLELTPDLCQKGLDPISGTMIREYISRNEAPPDWMMRTEVSQALLTIASNGGEVFVP